MTYNTETKELVISFLSKNEQRAFSAEEICKKVKADVDAFEGEAEQFDDITMLCVRWNEVEN